MKFYCDRCCKKRLWFYILGNIILEKEYISFYTILPPTPTNDKALSKPYLRMGSYRRSRHWSRLRFGVHQGNEGLNQFCKNHILIVFISYIYKISIIFEILTAINYLFSIMYMLLVLGAILSSFYKGYIMSPHWYTLKC